MGAVLLAAVLAFTLVIVIIVTFMRRVADLLITDQFRAAESISDRRFPQKWALQINRRLERKGVISFLQRGASGTDLALQKIDQLYRYFERSSFFEGPAARQMLLAQIQETRVCWAKKTWQEILVAYSVEEHSSI